MLSALSPLLEAENNGQNDANVEEEQSQEWIQQHGTISSCHSPRITFRPPLEDTTALMSAFLEPCTIEEMMADKSSN